MRLNHKELAAGGLFVLFGAFFAIVALRTLDIGTAQQMGPAYFPLLLATLLIVLGLAVAVRGLRVESTAFGVFPWRAVILLSLAPIAFAVTVRGLGLLPSVFLGSFAAAMGSSRMTLRNAVLVSAALALFSVLLFGYGLRLPLPTIGSWLTG